MTIDFYRYIVYGYLIKNYSKKFYTNTDYHVVKSSITNTTATARIVRIGGTEFILKINLKTNTITHLGDYSINKNYPNDKLIESAYNKFNIKQNGLPNNKN